ncbi:MAG: DUF885 family protein [Bdellovibrionales bacterium]
MLKVTKYLLVLLLNLLLVGQAIANADLDALTKKYHDFNVNEEHIMFDGKRYDFSLKANQRREIFLNNLYQDFEALDTSTFNSKEKLEYSKFEYVLKTKINFYHYKAYLMPVTLKRSRYSWYVYDLNSYRAKLKSKFKAEQYLKMIKLFNKEVDDLIELMREGIAQGITPSRNDFKNFESIFENYIFSKPEMTLEFKAFKKLGNDIPEKEKVQLIENAKEVIRTVSMPAWKRLYDFIITEYRPHLRTSIGINSIVNGEKYYQALIEQNTGAKLTKEEIHNLGIEELARIHLEMQKIMDSFGFKGSIQEFADFLQKEPLSFATSAKDLLKEISLISNNINKSFLQLFKSQTQIPFVVEEMDAARAASGYYAYYSPGSLESRRPGVFYMNTTNLKNAPLYELEALVLHEGVPGHHYELSRSRQTQSAIRDYYFTAFTEGWGLYAESLGAELGLYQTRETLFGRYVYEAYRAARLVVDTGIHSMGWSREEAIQFFSEASGKPRPESENQIDRYISMPGQALSYKVGEINFQNLRKKAEEELGNNLDIREFHEVLLEDGSAPFTYLEKKVDEAITSGRLRLKDSIDMPSIQIAN